MNSEVINTTFAEMIMRRGIEKQLGIPANRVYQYRSQLKNGPEISLDKKLQMLRKSGWKEADLQYSRADLVSLVKFVLKTSAKAKEFGPEYIVEKWEAKK